MPTKIKFSKMHGAGNDYIYVDTLSQNIPNPEATAIVWSDRHKGIGADGLVLIGRPSVEAADFSMRIFNADGSEAMMCGNASRCIGKYIYEKGLCRSNPIRLQTLSGIKLLYLTVADEKVNAVCVDMLEPKFEDLSQMAVPQPSTFETPVEIEGTSLVGTFVSMGNPHFVIFTEDAEDFPLETIGPKIENHALFPQRTNVEVASFGADGRVRVRVWERGSGITQACGTGACATAVAAHITGRKGRKSHIVMDGGMLEVEWREADNHVMLAGPATFVFEGEIELLD